ncbi:MAG: hypothetical protein KKA81_04640 [Bacteroidetes bacterium]|nr:hypothetical protein [Bacteroidota bacterium]
MKRSLKLIITVIIVITAYPALSQGVHEEEVWLEQLISEYYYDIPYQQSTNNKTLVVQEGSRNSVKIDQINTAGQGENLIYLVQRGDNNITNAWQKGSSNQYSLYQLGDRNELDLSMIGNSNQSALWQKGDMNKVTQDLKGTGMNYIILQEGFKNELIHVEDGRINQEYKIYMKGNGMKLYIQNSNIYH